MVKCDVYGCSTSSREKKKLYFFPTQHPDSLQAWISFCRLYKQDTTWIPSKKSAVCQEHFSQEDFMQNGDLRYGAVPTQAGSSLTSSFVVTSYWKVEVCVDDTTESWEKQWDIVPKPKHITNNIWLKSRQKPVVSIHVPNLQVQDESMSSCAGKFVVEANCRIMSPAAPESNLEGDNTTTTLNDVADETNISVAREKLLEAALQRSQATNKDLRHQLSSLMLQKSNVERNLERFLRHDQILYLQNTCQNNPRQWSEETIKNCSQLRYEVGNKSYDKLRERGWPLPCTRTLCRRIES